MEESMEFNKKIRIPEQVKKIQLKAPSTEYRDSMDDFDDGELNPEELLIKKENTDIKTGEAKIPSEYLDQLLPDARKIVQLKLEKNKSFEEISAETGIDLKSVQSKFKRAIKAMGRRMSIRPKLYK